MNAQEYRESKEALIKKHETELANLAKEYAMSNREYGIGDIIPAQTGGYLKIEQYTVASGYGFNSLPEVVYHGTKVKKDGTPLQRGGGEGYSYASHLKLLKEKGD